MRGEEAAAGRCRRRPRPRQHRTRIDGATAVPALLLGIVLAASKVIVQDGGFIPISFPAAEALPREETDRTRGGEIRRGGRDLLNIFERTSTEEVRAKATSSSLARNCNQKCRRCKRLARKGQKRRMRKCTRNRAKKCTSECDVVFWPNGRRPTGSPPGQRPTGPPTGQRPTGPPPPPPPPTAECASLCANADLACNDLKYYNDNIESIDGFKCWIDWNSCNCPQLNPPFCNNICFAENIEAECLRLYNWEPNRCSVIREVCADTGYELSPLFYNICRPPPPPTTSRPTFSPTRRPTSNPTTIESNLPTRIPSRVPSGLPSGRPSAVPSNRPSRMPSHVPSSRPSGAPSMGPSKSSMPSNRPSQLPSKRPSTVPSSAPSGCVLPGQTCASSGSLPCCQNAAPVPGSNEAYICENIPNVGGRCTITQKSSSPSQMPSDAPTAYACFVTATANIASGDADNNANCRTSTSTPTANPIASATKTLCTNVSGGVNSDQCNPQNAKDLPCCTGTCTATSTNDQYASSAPNGLANKIWKCIS